MLITSKNSSGTITSVLPSGIDCGSDCLEPYPNGTAVNLTAVPASGWSFSGWSDACTGTDTCTVTMSSNHFVTANFTTGNNILTVSKNGSGNITSIPAGIGCGSDCSESYPNGTTVTLTATPVSGWSFNGWSGACSGTGSCNISMTSDKSVTANFNQIGNYTLVVSKNGNGTITSTSPGIDCGNDCSENYSSGTTVTLTANSATGWSFSGWSGACSGSGLCEVNMTSNQSVTATFTVQQKTLSVSKSGTGSGTVTSNPSGINCGGDCSQSYNYGTSLTLTATPSSDSVFTSWSGDCSGSGACEVSMTSNKNATATFSIADIPNDHLANAIPITTVPYSRNQSLVGATRETGELDGDCPEDNSSVWFHYTPPANGTLTIETCGSDFDTTLSVWTGTEHPLTQVACNDDAVSGLCNGSLQSLLSITVTAGTMYSIRVAEYGLSAPTSMNLDFDLDFVPDADTTPPSPSPMTWATEPYAVDSTSIAMVATTATDSESPPVSYAFDFVDSPTGGSGGSDVSEQSIPSYTDTDLQPNHQYGYRVKAWDAASPPNETAPSSPTVYAYTLAKTPGAAAFSNVTQTSIQANWTANENPSGTEYYCENSTQGTNSDWTTSTSWTSSGLACGTSYSFQLKARNSDAIETAWQSLGSQTTAPCTDYCASASGGAAYEWVSRVQLNTGDQSSTGNPYSDYIGSVFTTLTREVSYTVFVTGTTTSSYIEYVNVWVDWNQDLDFADAGEEIDLGSYQFDGTHVFSQSFAVPAGAATGQTRMRVIMQYGSAPIPCGSYDWGETEDYTVEIVAPDITPPSPDPMTWATQPDAASSTSISMVATTATDAESPPVSYYFDFVSSSTGGTGGSDSGWQSSMSYTDSGLQANHQYSYRVQARDSASTPNVTSYSTTVAEYTLANTPTSAAFSTVTETSIQANWGTNGNRTGTEYYVENTTAGTNSGWTTNTSWTSSGLACSSTSYSFQVKARNSDAIETAWQSLGSQTTAPCTDYCASASGGAAYEWVSRVQLNTGDQSSTGNPYSDYIGSVFTTLTREVSYTVSVTGTTTSSYIEYVNVWVDWNQDLDFADAGEEIDLDSYQFDGTHVFSQSFAVPAGAATGQTRMRVIMQWSSAPIPCGSYTYGETEDYTIEIEPKQEQNSYILWTK